MITYLEYSYLCKNVFFCLCIYNIMSTPIQITELNKATYFSSSGTQLKANTTYELQEDITLNVNEHAILNDGLIFNGDGHSIKYRDINTPTQISEILGLFEYKPSTIPKNKPVISNINMHPDVGHVYITEGAGSIIRRESNNFTINNCSNSIQLSSTSLNPPGKQGGIVGSECHTFTVSNCYSIPPMNGPDSGGIVGSACHSCTIQNCFTTGEINGTNSGGIAGREFGGGLRSPETNSIIVNCFSLGDIIGDDCGGIVGASAGSNTDAGNYKSDVSYHGKCVIKFCYSAGIIQGENAGGIAGLDPGIGKETSCIIRSCYSSNGSPRDGSNKTLSLNTSGIATFTKILSVEINYNLTVQSCYSISGIINTGTQSQDSDAHTIYSSNQTHQFIHGNFHIDSLLNTDLNTNATTTQHQRYLNRNDYGNADDDVGLYIRDEFGSDEYREYPLLKVFTEEPWDVLYDNTTTPPTINTIDYHNFDVNPTLYSSNPPQASSSGDPHIYPLYGSIFELPNKITTYRMIEGNNLILNMSTRNISKFESKDIYNYYVKTIGLYNIENLIVSGVFYSNIWLNSEGNQLYYDYDSGICSVSNPNYFTCVSIKSKKCNGFELNEDMVEETISFTHSIYGNIALKIRHFVNPQIKYGISIRIQKKTSQLKGLFIREYLCNSMELPNITDTTNTNGIIAKNNITSIIENLDYKQKHRNTIQKINQHY